jgi:hypothetical protein
MYRLCRFMSATLQLEDLDRDSLRAKRSLVNEVGPMSAS